MPRILKFGINVGYDLLYCVKENQPSVAYYSTYLSIFFLSKQIFCYRFLSFYESHLVYTLRVAKYIEGQKTKLRFILPYFSFFFQLSLQCNTLGNL